MGGGFKKKGGKGKDKKKPKKKTRKDTEWDFEGGSALPYGDENKDNDERKKKRRETQDRDERFRRGKRKMEEHKMKKQFTKKMSKKITFSDVLHEGGESELEAATRQKEAKKPKIQHKSSLSVMERLNFFVEKSIDRGKGEADSEEEEIEEDEGDDTIDSDNGYDIDQNINTEEQEEEEEEEENEVVSGDESDGNDNNDETSNGDPIEEHETEVGKTNFDWFFSGSSSSSSNNRSKLKSLVKISKTLELYGNIHTDVPDTMYNSIQSESDLPGLHKLFFSSNRSNSNSDLGNAILPYLNTYVDAFIEGRDHVNDADLLESSVFHVCNHVLKARSRVLKHNQKLKQKTKDAVVSSIMAKDANPPGRASRRDKDKNKNGKNHPSQDTNPSDPSSLGLEVLDSDQVEGVMQDQGFTRPRVLILCPFRSSAKQIIEAMIETLGSNVSVAGLEKLQREFDKEEDSDDEEAEIERGGRGRDNRKPFKPPDWEALFDQNTDDDFKIGVQVNPGRGKGSGAEKGAYVRLFSDFFISDIVVASPIGLRLLVEEGEGRAKISGDFLSSIEIVYVHQADVLYMQNWDHVDYIMQMVNKLPDKQTDDTDFSRVRGYFLDGKGAQHRQLIVTSQFNEPELQSLFREYGQSLAGTVRLKKHADGSLTQVVTDVKQVFQMVPGVQSFDQQEEVRFRHFKDTVLANILHINQGRTLIVTPSYLSYVRVRNELLHRDASAVFVCEYSRESEISRGRSRFFHGVKDILLYSGRAHFFKRLHIRGAQHIVFYSLPQYADFYSEMVNMLSATEGFSQGKGGRGNEDEGEDLTSSGSGGGFLTLSCVVLFTQFEKMALERIVGKKRCDNMLSSAKTTFMFCS